LVTFVLSVSPIVALAGLVNPLQERTKSASNSVLPSIAIAGTAPKTLAVQLGPCGLAWFTVYVCPAMTKVSLRGDPEGFAGTV
jgi:hypothetical protein